MARARGPRYLTCFYCGKRARTRYDGATRRFTCEFCDAANYLDENGDITDPPVATETEAPAARFAAAAAAAPAPKADSIFCPTCLKNQHLFTASLAQYLPSDPSDPDYADRERNYYQYRRALEERYPQVCEPCAAKADGKIREAGFTAKTDHLRRMMERSADWRPARTRTPLDLAEKLGRWTWWLGLVLQLTWHLSAIADALRKPEDGPYVPDDRRMLDLAVSCLTRAVGYLPLPEKLIRWSVTAGILCFWWNPFFVQVNRGFTRHLMGLVQWYSFQALVVFLRLVFRSVLDSGQGKSQSRNARLSAHAVMATVMCWVYHLARRSIKVDTTALFDTSRETESVSPRTKRGSPLQPQEENLPSFPDELDEDHDLKMAGWRQSSSFQGHHHSPHPPPSRMPKGMVHAPMMPSFQLGTFPTRDGPSSPQVDPTDEMDWSPTTSPYRAFREVGPSQSTLRFGQAPLQPENGAFWYKVPPAPVTPAQKMRNPRLPVVRSETVEKQPRAFVRPEKRGAERRQSDSDGGIEFSQPRFFASQEESDDANSLADLLGKSFNLSHGREQRKDKSKTAYMWGSTGSVSAPSAPCGPVSPESVALAAILAVWMAAWIVPRPYAVEVQLVALCLAGIVALRSAGAASARRPPGAAAHVVSLLGTAELATLCWVGLESWTRRGGMDAYGGVVLTVMLGHQIWVGPA